MKNTIQIVIESKNCLFELIVCRETAPAVAGVNSREEKPRRGLKESEEIKKMSVNRLSFFKESLSSGSTQ